MLTLWTDVTYPRRMEPSHPYPSTKGIYRLRSNSHTPPEITANKLFALTPCGWTKKSGKYTKISTF